MLKITIRAMHEGDLVIVSELAMLANPFTTKEKYIKHLEDELRKNPDLSYVAISNGNVVGYVQADIEDSEAILEDLVIKEEVQGKGVGSLLLNRELTVLKQKRPKTLRTEVHYKCSSAIPFYYEHNFRIVGFEQDFYGEDHDAIILSRPL